MQYYISTKYQIIAFLLGFLRCIYVLLSCQLLWLNFNQSDMIESRCLIVIRPWNTSQKLSGTQTSKHCFAWQVNYIPGQRIYLFTAVDKIGQNPFLYILIHIADKYYQSQCYTGILHILVSISSLCIGSQFSG